MIATLRRLFRLEPFYLVLILRCSCGWTKNQDSNDPKGAMLEILKGIHESTFKDHKVVIEEG